ncbi:MAG TPA: hypothetical protein VFQ85_16815 [Mycobacteriales bacterium]|nr:hypothetical protein [Mycobacteriales bacterium]
MRHILLVAAVLLAAAPPAGAAGGVHRVPVRAAGDHGVNYAAVSGSGRYALYTTPANAEATDEPTSVHVRDLVTGRDDLVAEDVEPNTSYSRHSISDDGRYVVFSRWVPRKHGDPTWGVFLRDRLRRTTVRVDTSARGAKGDGWWTPAGISADGSTVSFESRCEDESLDTRVCSLWVYDVARRRARLVATRAVDSAVPMTLSRDGRYLAFVSNATLGRDDRRPSHCDNDVYLADLRTGRIEIVTGAVPGAVASSAGPGEECESGEWFGAPVVDATGRRVLFNALRYDGTGGHAEGLWVHDRALGWTFRIDQPAVSVSGAGLGGDLSADGRYAVYWALYAAGGTGPNPAGASAVLRVRVDDLDRERLDPPDAAHPCTANGCATTDVLMAAATAPGGALAFPYPSVGNDGRTVAWADTRRLTADDTDNRSDLYLWSA